MRLIRAVLSVLLSDAVDDGIILANAALQLRGSRRRRPDSISQAERQKKIRPMNHGQLAAFLATAQADSRHYPLFLLLARTGLRPGEAYALQWGDLDLRGREIRVERSLSAGQIETPKTGQTRTVDMSEQLAPPAPRDRPHGREAPPRVAGDAAVDLLHGRGDAARREPRTEALAQALKRAKLPGFRVYDLRHTFASLLLAQNAPITYVSAQLGHTDATTTLRWYARWLPRTDTRAVDMLDDGWVSPGERLGEAQVGSVGSQLVANPGSEDETGAPDDSEAPDLSGGPSGTRTPDPLIKRPETAANGHNQLQTAPRIPGLWPRRLGPDRILRSLVHGQ